MAVGSAQILLQYCPLKHKNLEFFTVFQDIIYLFMHSTVSCKTLNDISVEPLSENIILENVNGSNLFPFSDPKEKNQIILFIVEQNITLIAQTKKCQTISLFVANELISM